MIGKTDHAQLLGRQELCAFSVSHLLVVMDRTINFNHQPSFMTVEIDNKTIYDLLPAEVPTL